ncbi:hypothetical protein ACIQU6_23310 [Streptomyces sp. NPDC090442]|uniref:hypothetical protein n=1 Tax=Streptomyces sp. NPDC090442 TaxID=3365962 RepID=UPI0037F28C5E
MGEYASNDAAAALARATQLGSTVREGTRWYVRYQYVYGAAAGLAVLAIGLWKAPYGVAVGTGFWVAMVAWLSVYAARQPVARQGFGIRHGIMIGTWALLYAAVLTLGVIFFPGVAAWWVPGAVVVALPGLIGGYLEARR